MNKIKQMRTIDILIAVVAMYAMYMLYTCYSTKERMWIHESQPAPVPTTEEQPPAVAGDLPIIESSSCGAGAFVASNLLPKADAKMVEDGFEFAPNNLQGVNFLSAEETIGIDTVANSLRNANYNLREEPANPKTVVSIWNQSTIGDDLTRRPLN